MLFSFSPLLRDFGEDEGVGEDAGGGRGVEGGDFEGHGVGDDGGRGWRGAGGIGEMSRAERARQGTM